MLTNAVVAGLVASTYLVILVLQLNPQVPLASLTVARWFMVLLGHYGPLLIVVVYVLILVREALMPRPLLPAWVSVRVLAWLGAVGAAAAAWTMWANLKGFQAVLGEAAAERMRQGAMATTIIAAVLVSVAVLRYSFGRRGSRLTSALIVATLVSSVLVPIGLRGPGDLPVPGVRRSIAAPPPVEGPPHVRLLLLDGASLDFIRRRVAAGQLPNLGRAVDHGATIDLATLKPTQATPIWAAAVTGKYPPKTGIRSDALYRVLPDEDTPVSLLPDYCFAQSLLYQRFVTADPHLTAGALHARTLWDILTDYSIPSGITNLPLTRPARVDRGYIVSDYFDEATRDPLRLSDRQSAYPSTAVDTARDVFDAWQERPWFDAIARATSDEPPPIGVQAAIWDHAYSDTAATLDRQFSPRLTAVRYEGLNAFGKWYLEDAEPERFGQVGGTDRARSVLDRYYAFIDAEVGRVMAQLAPNDLLMVVSGFGMEDVILPKRLLARLLGRSDPNGGHERAPDGFLIAYGGNVARGRFSRGAIVDLAPTVLYYMGLPVGRDMDGYARTDLFWPGYGLSHTLKIIGTHENRIVP
jgi:hypothetical protein